jgi:hypothetical protein
MERPNPDIFWTDEEVAELKKKGIISTDPVPEVNVRGVCMCCGKPTEKDCVICDDCIPF